MPVGWVLSFSLKYFYEKQWQIDNDKCIKIKMLYKIKN